MLQKCNMSYHSLMSLKKFHLFLIKSQIKGHVPLCHCNIPLGYYFLLLLLMECALCLSGFPPGDLVPLTVQTYANCVNWLQYRYCLQV